MPLSLRPVLFHNNALMMASVGQCWVCVPHSCGCHGWCNLCFWMTDLCFNVCVSLCVCVCARACVRECVSVCTWVSVLVPEYAQVLDGSIIHACGGNCAMVWLRCHPVASSPPQLFILSLGHWLAHFHREQCRIDLFLRGVLKLSSVPFHPLCSPTPVTPRCKSIAHTCSMSFHYGNDPTRPLRLGGMRGCLCSI